MREIRINHRIVIPESEIRESFVTSTGPGGQNVNKVATKVELRWSPKDSASFREVEHGYLLLRLGQRLTDKGELLVTCEEHRTQARNRDEARAKLAAIVRQALHRPKPRSPHAALQGIGAAATRRQAPPLRCQKDPRQGPPRRLSECGSKRYAA